MRSTKYTREVLAPIVARAKSYREVLEALGLRVTGGNHRLIASRIRQGQLDTSHFTYGRGDTWCHALRREQLVELAAQCASVTQMLSRLGMPTRGRPHLQLTAHLRLVGIDISHFRGAGWARGETRDSHPSVDAAARKIELPDEIVFVENGRYLNGPSLVRRLLRLGWEYRCAWCAIHEWRGARLVLHLDHINGINNDNRLENLRLLCPNCHSQTDTYCNRAREERACYTSWHASVMKWQT